MAWNTNKKDRLSLTRKKVQRLRELLTKPMEKYFKTLSKQPTVEEAPVREKTLRELLTEPLETAPAAVTHKTLRQGLTQTMEKNLKTPQKNPTTVTAPVSNKKSFYILHDIVLSVFHNFPTFSPIYKELHVYITEFYSPFPF